MEVTGHCALQRILSCAKCYNFGVCICVAQPGVDPHPPQPRSDAASHGASQEPSSHERDDALTGQAAVQHRGTEERLCDGWDSYASIA